MDRDVWVLAGLTRFMHQKIKTKQEYDTKKRRYNNTGILEVPVKLYHKGQQLSQQDVAPFTRAGI